MREAIDDMRYLKTVEWMLSQSSSPAAGKIRTMLTDMRESVPQGWFVRVAQGNEHDRVDVAASPRYVEAYRRRLASWIGELLAAERGAFGEIRPGR